MTDAPRLPAGAGLCTHCRNARAVESRRGSRFVLCALSATDPRFPRYPPLPILHCDGFEELEPAPPTNPLTASPATRL
jgi:hypothetical protein